MFSLFKRPASKQRVDRRRSLAGIPVLNPRVTIETAKDGNLYVRVEIQRGRGFFARFQPRVSVRRIQLDELGSFVLRQVDGNKTVEDLIHAFVAHFRANRREAELCVVDFLKSLMRRQVISIGIR